MQNLLEKNSTPSFGNSQDPEQTKIRIYTVFNPHIDPGITEKMLTGTKIINTNKQRTCKKYIAIPYTLRL